MTTVPTNQMDPLEARRRFEKKLVLRGYSMSGHWVVRLIEHKNWETHSMALRGMPDCRAVMWLEGKERWVAMIAVAVGENGEFPITGGVITRWNMNEWQLGSFKSLSKRIEEVREQVRRWDFDFPRERANVAMIRLALDFLREGKSKKAISILLMALRGEISQATISESLSIVQMKVARSREDRLKSSLVWSHIFG